jgi:hypothetical protein
MNRGSETLGSAYESDECEACEARDQRKAWGVSPR